MRPVRYGDLLFKPDMLSATRDDGTVLRLTRQERALLMQLVRKPHTLVTRAKLLEGLGELAGDATGRNVDYLINRLRKRLGDDARSPRFIATQYGEGYLWIAEPAVAGEVSAFLLVGPIFGLEAENAQIIERLARAIGAALGGERRVECLPQWRFSAGAADRIDYSLEISLLEEDGATHMALFLKDGKTDASITPFRLTLPEAAPMQDEQLAAFAQTLLHAIWTHRAAPDGEPPRPTQPPLHLKLHDAGLLLASDAQSWVENAERLAQAHAAAPDDPTIAVLLALNRYSQLVLAPVTPGADPIDDARWAAMEDEIERLALNALAKADDDPMLLFGIAKVLFFIDRGYLRLAAELTDKAFTSSTAFAAAFAMKGQIEASLGQIERAVALYDKAIELAEPESQFHIYLLVIKGAALMAADRRGDVEHLTAELYSVDPASRMKLGLFFLSPRARSLPSPLKPVLAMLSPEMARDLLIHLYRVSARHFQKKLHQKNVLRGAATHLADHFGSDVIPTQLQEFFPELIKRCA